MITTHVSSQLQPTTDHDNVTPIEVDNSIETNGNNGDVDNKNTAQVGAKAQASEAGQLSDPIDAPEASSHQDARSTQTIASSSPEDSDAGDEPAPRLSRPLHVGQLFHQLIAQDQELDRCLLSFQFLGAHMQSLVWLTMLGLGTHGLFMGWMASYFSGIPSTSPMISMPVAMVVSFLGGLMICLPSFYFYTQLAGLDVPFSLVCAFAIRVLAKTSVLLFGVLPFYIAFALMHRHFELSLDMVLVIGMILPFVVGFWGLRTLYYAFGRMSHLFPKGYQHRGNFLLRIVMAWGGVFLVVAPVALHHLLQRL